MTHQLTPFASYLQHYLEYLRIRQYSGETITKHETAISRLIDWLALREITEPEDVTYPVLQRYQRHLHLLRLDNGKPLAAATQRNYLGAIKTFFQWLMRQNHIPSNPAEALELPRTPKKLPARILSQEELGTLFALPDTGTPTGLRDRAILETLYSTGVRRAELGGIRVHDLHPDQGIVAIRQGKGNKDRMVPIGRSALKWIQRYLERGREALVTPPDEGILFLTDRGEPFRKTRLSGLVKRYLNRAGIQGKGSCHIFRHTLATHLVDAGVEMAIVQEILGHENPQTTQVYARVAIGHLKAAHSQVIS